MLDALTTMRRVFRQLGEPIGDKRAVASSTDLTAAVRSTAPNTKVTLTVHRGNDTQKIDVTLGTSPS